MEYGGEESIGIADAADELVLLQVQAEEEQVLYALKGAAIERRQLVQVVALPVHVRHNGVEECAARLSDNGRAAKEVLEQVDAAHECRLENANDNVRRRRIGVVTFAALCVQLAHLLDDEVDERAQLPVVDVEHDVRLLVVLVEQQVGGGLGALPQLGHVNERRVEVEQDGRIEARLGEEQRHVEHLLGAREQLAPARLVYEQRQQERLAHRHRHRHCR